MSTAAPISLLALQPSLLENLLRTIAERNRFALMSVSEELVDDEYEYVNTTWNDVHDVPPGASVLSRNSRKIYREQYLPGRRAESESVTSRHRAPCRGGLDPRASWSSSCASVRSDLSGSRKTMCTAAHNAR